MKSVLVLLSTYNGSRYLQEQIDSVLNQDGVKVVLFIRDDGSTDNTLEILDRNSLNHDNIFVITGSNCRSAASFMELVYEANKTYPDFDYYAFCDQDDVWCKDKLISAVNKLSESPDDTPSLYIGAYQMVDLNLNKIETHITTPLLDVQSAISSNAATGCTMVFNRQLLSLVAAKKPTDFIMHDYWVYMVCLLCGGFVVYDSVPHILYRQHGHNVIGGLGDSFFKRWITRINKVFCSGDRYKSKLASQLLSCYSGLMSHDDKRFLEYVSTCSRFSSRFRLICNKKLLGRTFDKKMQMAGLIITGKL